MLEWAEIILVLGVGVLTIALPFYLVFRPTAPRRLSEMASLQVTPGRPAVLEFEFFEGQPFSIWLEYDISQLIGTRRPRSAPSDSRDRGPALLVALRIEAGGEVLFGHDGFCLSEDGSSPLPSPTGVASLNSHTREDSITRSLKATEHLATAPGVPAGTPVRVTAIVKPFEKTRVHALRLIASEVYHPS